MNNNKSNLKQVEEAFHLHYDNLVKFAIQLVGNYDDANDLCQEVYIAFHDNIDSIKNPQSWLYGALRNKVYNFFRSKKRENTVDIEKLSSVEAPVVEDKSQDIKILFYQMLEDESNFKDPDDKILLELIAFRGFTYEEAGKKIGLSKSKTRYKYNVLINRLCDYLQKSGLKDIEALLCMLIMITMP